MWLTVLVILLFLSVLHSCIKLKIKKLMERKKVNVLLVMSASDEFKWTDLDVEQKYTEFCITSVHMATEDSTNKDLDRSDVVLETDTFTIARLNYLCPAVYHESSIPISRNNRLLIRGSGYLCLVGYLTNPVNIFSSQEVILRSANFLINCMGIALVSEYFRTLNDFVGDS